MKCPNCFNIIMTPYQCRYCQNNFCSLSCLELHYSNYHLNNNNKVYSQNQHKINSPFLVKGILNDTIIYDSTYSLENFEPVFEQDGKIKTIGSGSYGQVYLGLNKITKNYYAIKHMDKKNIQDLLHSLTSTQKEIEFQSKIDHPNIVKLLYVRETELSYDLIMEYSPGGNLFHFIRKTKGLSENISFNLFIQVVNAINFLHENDLIHRDIKPENLLMFENNIVKLCDFGWCVKLDGKQRGTFCGTTEYMSPELVNRVGYGKEIDVWSLGVLLYEMIHGYSPFRPNKPDFEEKDVMENIINHNLIFEKNVSPECQKLIHGLLDPNIKNRYKVEDIYNSEFVKKYEQIYFGFQNNNFSFINQNQIQPQTQNQINNIVYSPQIEMNNNINIHMSMDLNNYIYNIQIPEKNNLYNYDENNSLKDKNQSLQKINKGIYSNYINASNNQGNLINNNFIDNANNDNNNYYITNILENKLSNIKDNLANVINISNLSNNDINSKQDNLNTNKTWDDFYTVNLGKSKDQELLNIYNSHTNDPYQNNKRDNKEFINFNNSILYLSGQNNNNNIFNNNLNEINKNLQLNSINNSQIIQKNESKEDKSTIEILNVLNKNIIDNLSYDNNISNINNNNLSYNNYNNLVNNYNKYPSLQASLIKRSYLIPNNNFNNLIYDSNSNNKNISISSIPSISTKIISEEKNNQNENNANINNINLISKSSIFPNLNRKISEFEIEDNKNINDRNINENDNIKIEINPYNDNLNDKKALSKSSIINRESIQKRIIKEPVDNLYGKRNDKTEEENIIINDINMSVNINNDNNYLQNNYFITNNQFEREYNINNIHNIQNFQLKKNLPVCNFEKKENKSNNSRINKINELKALNIPISKKINFDQPKDRIIKEEEASRNFQLPKSKSFCDNDLLQKMKKSKKNKNYINKDRNGNERHNLTNDKIKQKKQKLVNHLYRNKNDYSKKIFKEGNEIKKNENINKKETKEQMDNSFSDASCSLINVLWSKKEKKEKKVNNKISNSMMNKIPIKDPLISKSQDKIPKNSNINYLRKNKLITKSPIGKSKFQNINKIGNVPSHMMGLTPNAKSFIKFSSNNNINNKNQIIIGNINFYNNNSGNKYMNYLKISKTSDETKIIPKERGNQPNINYSNNKFLYPVKRDNQKILKPSFSLNNINENQKIKMNNINMNQNVKKMQFKKNKSKDISNDYKNKNIRKLNINIEPNNDTESNVIVNTSEYNDTNGEINRTPKKKSIFNKVKPNILLEAFRRELARQGKNNIVKLK